MSVGEKSARNCLKCTILKEMDSSTDISGADSHDSIMVGSARRVPIKLPELCADVDLNQVELEVIVEEQDAVPTNPPAPAKPPPRKSSRVSIKTKCYLVCYFVCCLCLCKRRNAATAVVPGVANKYRMADDQPFY